MTPSKTTRFNIFSARGQQILQEAHDAAKQEYGSDSVKTRADMVAGFRPRFGREPYPWQLDVGESFILKLDGVVVAGTGAGKTIPFMLPLLINPTKYILVISPLKVLQHDQVKRFRKMKISAAAVNGDTYSADLQEGLNSGKYQAIFTSPEMCLQHPSFRKWLRSEQATANILGLIIDEAHCISQWGGDFRKFYSMLDQLRGLMPIGTPVHAFSATMAPDALAEVCESLSINLGKAFFLNLGNDRPNITPSGVRMKSVTDYDALNAPLPNPTTVNSFEELPKAIVFTNSAPCSFYTVKKTHQICQHICKLYGSRFDENIAFLDAHRTRRAKRTAMRKFRQGKIRILVATETAGMGADIPDIELVIQSGFPKSLSVWIQRAGRAGRSPDLQAHAILLVEESAFQRWKKRRQKKPTLTNASDSESSDSSPNSDSESGANGAVPVAVAFSDVDDGKEWGKKVEDALRKYTSTRSCRRDVADEYFNNPARSRIDRYSQTSFSPEVILPDPTLTTLASNARIKTIDDIVSIIVNPPWMMAERHGREVLDLMARLDRADREARNAKTIENRQIRKRTTAARNAKKKNTPQPRTPVLADTSNRAALPFTPARTMPYAYPAIASPHPFSRAL
ncbi:P-loop containing nucleoside triphosphate hydrolase protein [Mycena epipterygia]|nr:P-loop containing nucleoside triphosphate hydrolase protein [Mycena epipterygia]